MKPSTLVDRLVKALNGQHIGAIVVSGAKGCDPAPKAAVSAEDAYRSFYASMTIDSSPTTMWSSRFYR